MITKRKLKQKTVDGVEKSRVREGRLMRGRGLLWEGRGLLYGAYDDAEMFSEKRLVCHGTERLTRNDNGHRCARCRRDACGKHSYAGCRLSVCDA